MRILHLEDSTSKYMDIGSVLKGMGIEDITWKLNVKSGLEELEAAIQKECPYALIISDMHYPMAVGEEADWGAGGKLLSLLKDKKLEIPVIICSTTEYRIKEAYGCIRYAKNTDWEAKLRELVQGLRKS